MKQLAMTSLSLLTICLALGCEQQEKENERVFDIETPNGGVEIEKSGDGVEIDINAKDGSGDSINIDINRDEGNDTNQ